MSQPFSSLSTAAPRPAPVPPHRAALAVAITGCLSLAALPTAGQQEAPASPSETVELLKEWVAAEKTLSAERAAWEAQKAEFSQLLQLYTQEIADLQALIAAAGQQATESEERRGALVREREDLQAFSNLLSRRLLQLEQRLVPLFPAFPPPLQTEIADAAARIRGADPGRALQDRARDLLAVLVEADKFQQRVSLDREVRELPGGGRTEIRIVYLGLARAFYIDASGKRAGIGHPSRDGWIWQPRDALAPAVLRAAALLEETRQEASFLPLPLQLDPASPSSAPAP